MAARLHLNTAMLIWGGSAVRVEEAFPDAMEQEESADALHTNMEGFQKDIAANTWLQLYFVGRASIQRWEPKGFNYRISLRMLDSHVREL